MTAAPPLDLAPVLAAAGLALREMVQAASGDGAARLSAARRFVALTDGLRSGADEAVAALAATLDQGGPAAPAAVRLLAALGTEAATVHLLAAAHGGGLALSQGALQALTQLEPSLANAALLIARWQRPPAPGVGFQLARAIARQPATPALLDWASALLADPPGTEYADAVVRGIAASRSPTIVDWLRALSGSRRAEARTAALGALLRAGDAGGLDALLRLAGSGGAASRVRALVWLYGAPFAAVEPAFSAALQDASAALREAALLGLPFCASPPMLPAGAALLADRKPAVAHQAQAVYLLLTGVPTPLDPASAQRLAMQVAARMPVTVRCLQGRLLEPTQLAVLLCDASFAAVADAALRMLSADAPAFQPDGDLIRNLAAVDDWLQRAQAMAQQMPPGSRWYAGKRLP